MPASGAGLEVGERGGPSPLGCAVARPACLKREGKGGCVMRNHVRNAVAVLAAAVLVVSGCGGTEDEPTVDETLSATEVASRLITADDLEGKWAVNLSDDMMTESGVVSEESAEELAEEFALCDSASAEAKAAAAGLRWQALRQLDMTVDDPIDPPGDMSGRMVFVQEYLLSGDPGEVEATFADLTSGLQACMGQSSEGGTSEPWSVAQVGDESFGVLDTIGEPGGDATWLGYSALVRDGSILMAGIVADIFMGEGVTAEFDADEVDQIITTMAEKIG